MPGLISKEELSALETKHGRIAHVKGKGGTWEVVFRKPTRQEYRFLRSRLADVRTKADAQEDLSRMLVVYPDANGYDALLEEWPGIPEACTEPFLALCGLEAEASGK